MKTEAKPGLNDVMYLLALLACCVASSALAATYNWATNGNTADFGTGSTVSTLTLDGAISGAASVTFSSDSTIANNSQQTILLTAPSSYTGSHPQLGTPQDRGWSILWVRQN